MTIGAYHIYQPAFPVKSASFILLQGVPSGISLEEVDRAIRDVEGVQDVHELHIWQLSETKVVASVHVLTNPKFDFMKVALEIRGALHERGIHSSTIQPEYHPSRISLPVSSMLDLPSRIRRILRVDHFSATPLGRHPVW